MSGRREQLGALDLALDGVGAASTLAGLARAVAAAGLPGGALRSRSLAEALRRDRAPWKVAWAMRDGLKGAPTVGEALDDPLIRHKLDRLGSDVLEYLVDSLRGFLARELLDRRGQLLADRIEERLLAAGGRRLAPAMGRPALNRWIVAMEVGHWALLPASTLGRSPDLTVAEGGWLDRYGERATIADLVSDPDRPKQDRPPPRRLRDRAIERLRLEAGRVAQGREEEASHPPPPPGRPELAELHGRLVEARAHVRSHVPPRPRHLLGESDVVFDPERMVLRVREHVDAACGGQRAPEVEVAVRPVPVEERVTCTCPRRERAGRCSVALAALDAVLGLLPVDEAMARDVAEELARPDWSRLLERVDGLLPPPASSDPDCARLGWRVDDELLEIKPVECRPRRGGGFGARALSWKRAVSDPDLERLPVDGKILQLLQQDGRSAPDEAGAIRLLEGHPRVFVGRRGSRHLSVRPARVDLRLDAEDGRFRWQVRLDGAVLDADGLRQLQRRAIRSVPAWVDADEGICRVLDLGAEAVQLLRILAASPPWLEPEAGEAFLDRLPRLEALLPVELGEGLAGRLEPPDPTPLVRLELEPDGALRVRLRTRPLPEGPLCLPGSGSPFLHAHREDRLVHTRRDLPAEAAAARRLAEAVGLRPDEAAQPAGELLVDLDASVDLLDRLQGLEPPPTVDWLSTRRRSLLSVSGAAGLRIALRRAGDWFAVGGSLEVAGASVPLEDVLAALEAGRRFVRVDGERWAALDEELRSLVGEATAGVVLRAGGRVIAPVHAPALQRLAEAGAELDVPTSWLQTLDAIRDAAAWEPPVPEGLVGELRPYQVEGYRWLARLSRWAGGACLADDMGLGKTVQALALLLLRGSEGPALVAAPTSVGWNWLGEAARFAPSLRAVEYRGPGREALLADLGPGDLVVTSWTLLMRDRESLAAVEWGTFVLDEAQAVKNPAAERSKAARTIRAGFRAALTGTPVENRTGDLWSLYRILIPGLLGSQETFRRRFALPIERRRDPAARELLAATVRPFLLRRLKGEVESDLPPRTEIVHRLVLSEAERRLYEGVRTTALAALEQAGQDEGAGVRFQVLAALTRLRQACCHPRLLDPASTVPSTKEKALLRLVTDLRDEGHRALIFSQFVRHLELARAALLEAGWRCLQLDGSTPAKERQRLVEEFQAGTGDVFLISLKAGGTGLNLTAASYVIHLDPWWNPAAEDQASDRTHRIGQTRPVTVYRLVAGETVEEQILELQADKRELVQALISGADRVAPLSVEELVGLLSEAR